MSHLLFALNWEPEIRGIVVVLLMFLGLAGTSYMVVGTNLGARLGLLTCLAALFGWLALMGSIWWAYGIGLKGADPSWTPKSIFHGTEQLAKDPLTADLGARLTTDASSTDLGKWTVLPDGNSKRGQAAASSDDILLNKSKLFTSTTDYTTLEVFDIGGKAFPKLFNSDSLDFLAFKHTTHYALVKVQANVGQNTEPGAAPPKPIVDNTKSPVYVLMERNLGYKRRPAALIAFGSALIFGVLVSMMHSRDKRSMAARSGSTALAKV